jgi:hypothetical protein
MKPGSLKFAALCGIFLLAGCGGNGGGPGSDPDILPLTLPFSYTVGAQALEVPTSGGTLHVSIGPYGSHFQPLSGDPIGDAKSNLIGYFGIDATELVDVPGGGSNDDGICDTGESCAFWGGLNGEHIRSRIPTYIAPVAARLTHLRLDSGPNPFYFDMAVQWEIVLRLNARFSLRIGHLGGIAPTLRDKILAATGIDTDSYTSPVGNLFTGASIDVAAGDALAFPQIIAQELPGLPGYYISDGNTIFPWAQMEFTIADHDEGADVCVYDLMATGETAAIQAAMSAEMANPDSTRYRSYATSRWAWGAEGLLCPVYSPQPEDFSNIHTRFGGWTERPEAGTNVDEMFAIVKIAKTAASYDAANYDSAAVNHLAMRAVGPALPSFSWTMPDAAVVTPFIAQGEVIEESADTLLIMWRDIGWTGPVYQRAAFLLDSQGLKIKWGVFGATAIDAARPALDAGDACNDIDTLCYDHQARL